MAVNIPIWPGSASFFPGDTPFGLYDTDITFQNDAENVAVWCAKRMGYPIVDIELQQANFFAAFEEAVTEYGAQVNRFNIRENLLNLKGESTSSNLTHKNITPNLSRIIDLSKTYGSEAGVGGNVEYKSGSIDVVAGQQVYDLQSLWGDVSESSNRIEIKRVFYQSAPALTRFFDPYVGTGYGTSQMLSSFGWGTYSPAVNYLLMPMYDDLLRIQSIEFNDTVRRSHYSFELRNNKLKVFPKPSSGTYKLWFEYIVESDRSNPLGPDNGAGISDSSNVPYNNMEYSFINDPGKQWIRKYTLALAKEMLGIVRSKYGSIPIPNAEVNLDGDTLRTEASVEKETLITQLREELEALSRRNMLERQKEESEFQQDIISRSPLNIYLG